MKRCLMPTRTEGAISTFSLLPGELKAINSGPLLITPNYSFANSPHIDYLVVPGGVLRQPFNDDSTLRWIRSVLR